MHRSLLLRLGSSCLSLLSLNTPLTSAAPAPAPQLSPPQTDLHDYMAGEIGNFTDTCHSVSFDDNTCLLKATCKTGNKQDEKISELNLNKCLFYGDITGVDPNGEWPSVIYAISGNLFYWYGMDKQGKVVEDGKVEGWRFRPGSFCDKQTCESCRVENAKDINGYGDGMFLICMCRTKVGDHQSVKETSSYITNEVFNQNGQLMCFGRTGADWSGH
ncbi:hypothetical protein B0T20DRAFT_394102 [Sordaria brevicollis]|uniref:Cyanovirin-N domain-containing protein n=1 Tax=Sordaria brevicollis TaxID=83679 RepID=A0AAE0UAJ2_SORBR|nr:hypothetical protein B0T20DRAFT_394102 [Sordaria brevicollis]